MKKYILFFLLTPLISLAQIDSTQIKLEQYKKWYELGLITPEEYENTKAKLLNIQPVKPQQQKSVVYVPVRKIDTMQMETLREKYKAEIVSGAIFTSIGGSLLVTSIITSVSYNIPYPTDPGYQNAIVRRNSIIGSTVVLGTVCLAVGIVNISMGVHKKRVYFNRLNNAPVTLKFKPDQVGLCFKF